jgi:hypothetical protein
VQERAVFPLHTHARGYETCVDDSPAVRGYDVITSDDAKVGEVVDVVGDNFIVEHGTLRKHRNALPKTFAQVDGDAGVVRTTLSKQIIEQSPEVDRDEALDERAVAAYYGLAAGYDSPPTQGYGEVNPDDPALTADQLTRRLGMTPPEEERAQIREGESDVYGPAGRPIHPADPHVTGEPRSND